MPNKYPQTIMSTAAAWIVDTKQERSLLSCFFKIAEFSPTILIIATLLQENHQTRQRFCPVLVSLCELKLQLPILSWLEWHMVWSLGLQQQYAVILLLKTCAMVWGATFVLSGGFFELLLPSYQFILLWFLASTMHFHREKLVRIFSLWPFSVNFDCVGRWQ